MRWWRNNKSSEALDRGTSGGTRAATKSKKLRKPTSGSLGPQAEKFNLNTNSYYLGLWSVGGM